jgi:type I restriction-modification system DNA methylase subunit
LASSSKYDNLDPRTQLEQAITADLKRALDKRGFHTEHQGTELNSALGDRPDIIVENGTVRINVEVTTSTKSASDREYPAIKDHLVRTKQTNSNKKCFIIYVSPSTHYRMINEMRDFNILRKNESDMKMLPLSFANFEFLINKLVTSPPDLYQKKQLMSIFDEYRFFVDDARVLEILYNKVFSDDETLRKEIEAQEQEKHQRTVDELINDLLQLEDDLREQKLIVHLEAIRDIIFLVFIKLYEEKREFEDKENRFKEETFKRYQANLGQETEKKAIHKLFESIKDDKELKQASVFSKNDNLSERIDDDLVLNFFIKPFEKYHFYTTRIDGIGAAYEILGMRTGKDVKAGQFFTPENVVKFMQKLAELETEDVVLDPACGTARFLVYAMRDMQEKTKSERNSEKKQKTIATSQLFGTDYDPNVSKLAKMNMYINGDGKSNVFDRDGLLLYDREDKSAIYDMDGKIDVILTNPPLGDQSFLKSDYDDYFKFERMQIIPRKNLTEAQLTTQIERMSKLQRRLSAAQIDQNMALAQRLTRMIRTSEQKINELRGIIAANKSKLVPLGTQLKGGALFIGAAQHYLKSVRNKDLPIEWQGGKMLIVLDEGILNSAEYEHVRTFLRTHFYIKAVFSLSRDTFVPVSSTTTKTSILYAIKKKDPDALQTEPIFFAHAEKVGVDTRGKICENHLFDDGNDILSKYFDFKTKVRDSYSGLKFSKEKFERQGFKDGTIERGG